MMPLDTGSLSFYIELLCLSLLLLLVVTANEGHSLEWTSCALLALVKKKFLYFLVLVSVNGRSPACRCSGDFCFPRLSLWCLVFKTKSQDYRVGFEFWNWL